MLICPLLHHRLVRAPKSAPGQRKHRSKRMFWKKKNPKPEPTKQVLSISTDRPTLEITLTDGTVTKWSYDVVVLKLKIQQIQEQSGNQVPSQTDLEAFRDCLIVLGMPECNVDIALRIWSVVLVQFQQVALAIARQVEQCRSN